MLPELMNTFHIPATDLGHLIAFYYYAYTPAQIPVGVLMDRYGPRFILTMAVLACSVGTFLFGGTETYWVAACGRFLVGLGSAFAFVGVLKLASVWLPPNRFAFISGMTTTLGMVGAIAGQMIMTGLVHELGWQETVIYSGIVGFLLTPVIWLVIRDVPNAAASALQRQAKIGFSTLMKQVAAIALHRQMWINGFIGCLLYLPTSVFAEAWGVHYLQIAHGLTPSVAAVAVSMVFLGWAIGGPIAGLVSDKVHNRRIPLLVGAIVASLLMMVLIFGKTLPTPLILFMLLVFGMFSAAEVICFAVGRELSAPHLSGTAVATTNFLIMLGGMICQPVVGRILDLNWDGAMLNGIRQYSPEAYQTALLMLPLGLLIAVGLTFLLKETHCKPIAAQG
jgi:MFS family permease